MASRKVKKAGKETVPKKIRRPRIKKAERLELIRAAVKTVEYKVAVGQLPPKKKLQRTRPIIRGLEAFDESFMFDDKKTIYRVMQESGIIDSYRDTTRFDAEVYE